MRTIFRSMLVVGWLVGIPKNKFQPTRANLSFETLNIHGLHPWPRNVISSPERRTCRESRDSFGAARNSLSFSLPFQVYPLRWKKKVTFEHSLTEQRWAPTTLELGKRGVFLSFRYIYIYICGVSYEPSSTRFASFEKFVHFEIFTFRILTFQSNFLTLIFISFALFNYLFNYLFRI